MRFIKQGKKGRKKHSKSRSKSASTMPSLQHGGARQRQAMKGRQQWAVASALVASTTLTAGIATRAGGMQSPGVTGIYTPRHALQQLLHGTPLTSHFTDGKTVVISADSIGHMSLTGVSIVATVNPVAPSSPKYTESLRDIPQSLIVIPKIVIQEQGAPTLRNVLRNVPGITINAGEGGSTPGDNFNVRGFSARSDIYIDGARDEGGYTRDAFAFEQVEVAEGPASVYDGRGSTGGSINMVTKTPRLQTDREVTIAGGSTDQRRLTADINQPLNVPGIPGAALRFNALWNDGGVPGNAVVQNKGWGMAPSLAVGLGSPTVFTLSYLRTGQNNIPAYGVQDFTGVPAVDTRNFFGLNGLDFERVAANNLTAKLEHDFGGSVQFHQQLTRDHSETNRIVTYTNITNSNRSPKSHITDDDILASQTSLTAIAKTGAVEHAVVAGVDVSQENSLFGHYTIAGTPPAVSDLNDPTTPAGYDPTVTIIPYPHKVRATALGLYSFDTMKFGDHWEVNAGLRWDQFVPHYSDSISHQVASANAVSGRVGLVYKPTSEASLYAAYGNSFNPSVQNLAYDNVTTSNLQPEENHSVEVGTKWELFKRRLLATWALFRTDKVNARTPDPTNASVTILDGNQRVQGMELHATGKLTHAWDVLTGYTYLEGKYLKSGTASQVGKSLNSVPKHSTSLWTTYHLPAHLEVGGGMRYVDRQRLSSNSGTTWVPSYHVYNAELPYHVMDRLGLRLNVNNLTNKLYYDNGRFWVPAPARSVMLSTTAEF